MDRISQEGADQTPATNSKQRKVRQPDTPELKAQRAARKSKAKYAQSFDIMTNPPDKTSNGKVIAYTPYFTTQFGLPHSPVKGEKWVRKDGNRTLRITADSRYGVPYGSIPRLLIAWVATWQVRHPSATVIELGKNLSSFLEDELHLPRTGKYIRNVKEQLIALFTSKISVTVEDDVPDHFGYKSAQLADEIELWWHTDTQDALWNCPRLQCSTGNCPRLQCSTVAPRTAQTPSSGKTQRCQAHQNSRHQRPPCDRSTTPIGNRSCSPGAIACANAGVSVIVSRPPPDRRPSQTRKQHLPRPIYR